MQKRMVLEACTWCGNAVLPGQPAVQTVSVDVVGGKIVASPTKTYHITGGCHDAAEAAEAARRAAGRPDAA